MQKWNRFADIAYFDILFFNFQAILTESVKVFELNNVVIKSVKGMNQVLVRRAIKVLISIILLLLFLFAIFFKNASELEVEGDVFDLNMGQDKQELWYYQCFLEGNILNSRL